MWTRPSAVSAWPLLAACALLALSVQPWQARAAEADRLAGSREAGAATPRPDSPHPDSPHPDSPHPDSPRPDSPRPDSPAASPAGLPNAVGGSADVPPDSLSAGVFPLRDVRRGQQGVAYTVFEGVHPRPVPVEILGVLRNALGPHQDLILSRLGGEQAAYTGVVAGMSGSPVYIGGRLVGALAYRIGQFSKEPIAGITPIEQMLEVGEIARSQPAPRPAPSAGAEIRPIDTPLVFSGFSPQAVDAFRDRFAAQGLTPVAGLGGSDGAARQPEPIEPGSSVSALLVRGDMEIAATCTATWVTPRQLLACGHPITQAGALSVPMTKADVVATLPSPLNAFKIVNTTEEVGAFTQDRETAISGQFGRRAAMVPVTVTFHDDGGQTRPVHFEVADNPDLTPLLILTSLYQSMLESNRYAAETTYRLRERIRFAGEPEARLTRVAGPSGLLPAALSATLEAGEPLIQLYGDATRRGALEAVTLDIDALPGRRTIEIEQASREGGVVHAGDTVTLHAILRPYRGLPRTVSIPVALPATLPAGPLRLVVSDAATVDRMFAPQGGHLDMREAIAALNATRPNDRLYVTMLTPSPQARLDGQTLGELPLSTANMLDPMRTSRDMTLNGESATPVTSIPLDAAVSGNQVITLQIE